MPQRLPGITSDELSAEAGNGLGGSYVYSWLR